MATLGELERSIMEILWASDESLSAYDLQELLSDRKLAGQTALRRELKGVVGTRLLFEPMDGAILVLRFLEAGFEPALARHTGRPLSLEDWHRVANDLPTLAEEPAFEISFDEAMQAAYGGGLLPFDSREPHLLWRSRAARLIQAPDALEIDAEGQLTITDVSIAFAFGLRRWRVPFDAVLDVFERDDAIWFVLASHTDPVVFEVEDAEWTAYPESGPRTILLDVKDLVARIRRSS